MKRLAILLMCLLILLCSCGNEKDGFSKKLKKNIIDPADLKLGGYTAENGYVYLDESDPLVLIAEYERGVELSNGERDVAYMKLPYINVDLEGAKAVSEHLNADYTTKYGDYFKKPDDRIVQVDYTSSIVQDSLAIFVHETVTTPTEKGTITYAFYYDILVDCELPLSSYAGVCGSTLSEIMEGLESTDWAADYLTQTGIEPNDSCITALDFNADDQTFDVYCINPDGTTQTVVNVTPVDQELDFSGLEIS